LTAKSILTSAGSPFNPILFLLYKRAFRGGNFIDMILSDRVDLHMPVFQLTEKIVFPRPNLAEKNGLLAIGGDLSPERLIVAYRSGIFPWYSQDDPILWWCTSPRLVIFPNEFKIPKRLYRDIKKPLYRVTMDHAFEQVISSCARVRTDRHEETWISTAMKDAYYRLHRLGYAHSVECWQGEQLAGGLYGVALDHVFFGESMFTILKNGSKIALAALVDFSRKRGFQLIDCQMTTAHLLGFGAREISGTEFQDLLKTLIKTLSPDGVWYNDPTTGYRNL
jgi:leucyl/phenylalanyl-tRNA---protein transferase